MSSRSWNRSLFVRPLDPGIGEAVARRTVLREGETWGDVASRVALGNALLHHTGRGDLLTLERHIASGLLLMSGRHLQHGDATQPGRGLEVFSNCSSASTSSMKFYLLLNGSGVGRCYDDDLMLVDWRNAPAVVLVLDEDHPDYRDGVGWATDRAWEGPVYHQVADSREGWGKAVELLETMTWRGSAKLLVLDFSKVRPKGSPIRGMQGRPSAGPVPTMRAIQSILEMAARARANPEEWPRWKQALYVDHYLADCVHLGGARRAARIAVKYWRDPGILEYCRIKRDGGLWSANMSVGVDGDFYAALWDATHPEHVWARRVADAVVDGQYADRTGEPGTVNVHKLHCDVRGLAEVAEAGPGSAAFRPDDDALALYRELGRIVVSRRWQMVTNPCFSADATVLTPEGGKRLGDIEPGATIWTGKAWTKVLHKWQSGVEEVFQYVTHFGQIFCTQNHPVFQNGVKVEAGLADEIDVAWEKPGSPPMSAVVVSRVSLGRQPVFNITVEDPEHAFWCGGLLVTNCGEITLSLLGAFCVIGDLALANAYELETVQLMRRAQAPYWSEKYQDTVTKDTEREEWLQDALDALRKEVEDAARAAVRALMRVNLLPSVYELEVRRTNRIGVSLTGIHEFAWQAFGFGFRDLLDEARSKPFWDFLAYLKRAVADEAKRYAAELGVNVPHTNTTIKPAGTTSKLFSITEGAHLPAMRQYLRWVMFQQEDPLVAEYETAGYPVQRGLRGYESMAIVGFPTKPLISTLGMGDRLVTAGEATLDEQFQWLRLLEKYWIVGVDEAGQPLPDTGNQISYTAKFDPANLTRDQLFEVLWRNQESVRCASVMPQVDMTAYAYQPEEPVSEERFAEIEGRIAARRSEELDMEALRCANGACPI